MLVFVTACVPGGAKKEKASCAAGSTFNAKTRSCSSSGLTGIDTPQGTLSSINVLEDSAAYVTLNYYDRNNDKALSCSASSSGDGLVRNTTFSGVTLTSQSSVTDAQNIQIVVTNTGVLSVSTTTLGSTKLITLNIDAATTTSLAAASAINAHVTASTWVSASIQTNQLVSSSSFSYALTSLSCFCTGGLCRTFVQTADDYNGTTDVVYSITDKDGTGAQAVASLTIASVNDTPSLAVIAPFAVTERLDSDTTTVLSGNLITNNYVTANDSADGDVLGTTLVFELVTAPTRGTLSLDSLGNFSYYTYSELPSDSFTFRVRDTDGAYTATETMTINITNVNDPPVGTLSSLTSFNEDSNANGGAAITLTYSDEEGNSATSCTISSVSNVYPTSNCVCAAGVCQVTMKGANNASGASSFGYKLFDASGGTPVEQIVNFTISSVEDSPVMLLT